MTFDGNSHRVRIIEVAGGSTASTRQFVWGDERADNEEIEELRDGTGAVLSKYFGYGQTTSGTNYFYTRDQIRSVRELSAAAGTVQSQYVYSPFGLVTNLQSGVQSDFQFGGYYVHIPSGLDLTVHRAYQPGFGRWISRDPAGETGGTNVYEYISNRPTCLIDPSGLQAWNPFTDPTIPYEPPIPYSPPDNVGMIPVCVPGGPPGPRPIPLPRPKPWPPVRCPKPKKCEPPLYDPEWDSYELCSLYCNLFCKGVHQWQHCEDECFKHWKGKRM